MPGKGIVLNEPTYVAYDIETERIVYAGRRAYYLEGREPQGVAVIQPVKDGVISNYSMTQQMVRYFINRVIKKSIFKPRVVATYPSMATDIEKRTLISVIISAGARSVCLIEKPLCAAFGAGVNPIEPKGVCVVDIGGGVTDMAIIAQGSMNQIESTKIAGDDFDSEIIRFVKEKHNILIGQRTAEDIKKNIGCAVPRDEDVAMTVKGQGVADGLPMTAEVTSNEIFHCLKPLLAEITSGAKAMIERTSPQLMADIASTSVLLTGGSAQLYGLDTLFSQVLELEVKVADQPELCVAKGAMIALNRMNILDNYGYQFKTKEDVRIR